MSRGQYPCARREAFCSPWRSCGIKGARRSATVAQSVERIHGKDEVPGSIPGGGSRIGGIAKSFGFWSRHSFKQGAHCVANKAESPLAMNVVPYHDQPAAALRLRVFRRTVKPYQCLGRPRHHPRRPLISLSSKKRGRYTNQQSKMVPGIRCMLCGGHGATCSIPPKRTAGCSGGTPGFKEILFTILLHNWRCGYRCGTACGRFFHLWRERIISG